MRILLLALILPLAPAHLVWSAAASGQQPLRIPVPPRGGTLELQFDLHTHPGGAPSGNIPGLTRINVHVSFSKQDIRADREGKFSFEAQGEYHQDSAGGAGGASFSNDEHRHGTLTVTGKIAADDTIDLKLEWRHGQGLLIYTTPQGTFSAQQPAVAAPHTIELKLAPASRQVENLGNDRGRETIKYKSQQPSTVMGTFAAPMTERVKIKLVRGLVPRG